MKHLFRQMINCALCLMFLLGWACTASAQSKQAKKINEATERSRKAARDVTEILAAPDKDIPQDLLDKREGVAVFPNGIKAGFIICGGAAHAVSSRRLIG